MSLLAEVDLPHMARQVGGLNVAVAALLMYVSLLLFLFLLCCCYCMYLVYPGVEMSGGVTEQGIGHQQQVEPLEEHHHSPTGQGLAETSMQYNVFLARNALRVCF